MAYLPSSLSSILFLALVVALIFVSPTYSTSRGALIQPSLDQAGFKVSIEHVDSGGNFTKFERLQRAMKRGRHRLRRFSSLAAKTDSGSTSLVQAPVHPGSGEFLMKLSLGTPPVSYSAIVDTGSDLIWTQCKPCQQCFKQSTPIFDPKKSSSFSKLSCSSDLCSKLDTASCSNDCEYTYSYGDYSSTQGVLASETFTFDKVSVPNVGFGCGADNEGQGFEQGAGLVGLGRGPLSLVSQLGEPKFSYCLTSIDGSKTSTLLMGSTASVNSTGVGVGGGGGAIKTTPLLKNPSQPAFYYLPLEGITVGGTKLPIDKSTFAINADDGSGGVIIDSGTTLTYLEQSAFDVMKKAFISQTKLKVDDAGSSSTGLDLCFTLPSDASSVEIPKLVYHFKGADLELPGENYMIADSSLGLMCLAMEGSQGMSILGNIQQQNILVVYDLAKETMSFVPTQCDQLS